MLRQRKGRLCGWGPRRRTQTGAFSLSRAMFYRVPHGNRIAQLSGIPPAAPALYSMSPPRLGRVLGAPEASPSPPSTNPAERMTSPGVSWSFREVILGRRELGGSRGKQQGKDLLANRELP